MEEEPVEKHPFLSEEWLAEARRIREEFGGSGHAVPRAVRMNQVITEVPFGEGTVQAHIDTTSGILEMETGHLDDPDVTVTLDYETARAIFVDGTPEAGMQAFMAGKIRVQGDMAKLISAIQEAAPADPSLGEAARRIKAITA